MAYDGSDYGHISERPPGEECGKDKKKRIHEQMNCTGDLVGHLWLLVCDEPLIVLHDA